jgi:hypothetical protein
MEEKIDIFRTSADPEHTFSFVSTPNNRLLLEVFLHNHHSFLKRVVVAVKYIFGHKSQWGHWDLLEIDEDDAQRMWVLLHRHRAKILNEKK